MQGSVGHSTAGRSGIAQRPGDTNESHAEGLIRLGRSEVRCRPLGVGAWSWGDRLFWGYGRGYGEAEVQGAFEASIASGVTLIDTAEVYGLGQSERLLGGFIREAGAPGQGADPEGSGQGAGDHVVPSVAPIVATKFLPLPWRLRHGDLVKALRGSLKRLGLERVDLYQLHFPLPLLTVDARMDALASAVEAGLARAVGVSNYGAADLRKAHYALARRGIPLASNQVQYSLAHRRPERDGMAEACRDLGVTLIAYSPLGMGALTGKYGVQRPLPGVRGRQYGRRRLEEMQPLLDAMGQLGAVHGGASVPQVALNWLLCKGTVPIPGAKNARQAQENAGALGWRLAPEEVAKLDHLSGGVGES
ncbi:MAG: aldo/keto reductase [Chloroflexota bacterium]|nr:aldo/keto reductase [Chloroflexota bacterium]